MNPVISIIVPVFNGERTLDDSLKSIISQEFKDFEIILIDGKSSDGTVGIIKEYAKNYGNIRWQSEKDQGVYDAMNKGIELARGRWLFFLGSDDQLYNNEVLKQTFENTYLDRFNVAYGNVVINGNSTWAKDGDIYDGEFDLKKLIRKNICHQGIFYKTDFVRKQIGHYNVQYKLCADWDFNLRCRAKSGFLFLDRIIAKFNAGGETTKTNLDPEFYRDFIPNLLSYFNITPFNPLVNDPSFQAYHEVVRMQKEQHYLHYLIARVGKYFSRT